jgi:ATP-independent RNA helicase DbpA
LYEIIKTFDNAYAVVCFDALPKLIPVVLENLMSATFNQLPIAEALITNLTDLGYLQMTPVQAESLPVILAKKDLIAQAKTGSGKTAAFGLGLLSLLDVKRFRVQSLVLCPTRELADQVANEIRRLGRTIHNIKVLTLCGGVPFGPQLGSLEHGAHIIVGTPGRIEEHLVKGSLKLDDLELLVLDEADRMLEMGFAPTLDKIMTFAPKSRQTLLFSATFPKQIEQLASALLTNPTRVTIESAHTELSISQQLFRVQGAAARLQAVQLLLKHHQPTSSLVFCNTRRECQDVADALHDAGFSVLALHGDLEQRDRDQTLIRFANRSLSVLVATDVAARGLDIAALDLVINYQLAHDVETHTHRIGRTGRAGQQGLACSLFDQADEFKVALINDELATPLQETALPALEVLNKLAPVPPMACLQIDAGKKQKLRAGDIVGALTREQSIQGDEIGKIQLGDDNAYVAVPRAKLKLAQQLLAAGVKGRKLRVWPF